MNPASFRGLLIPALLPFHLSFLERREQKPARFIPHFHEDKSSTVSGKKERERTFSSSLVHFQADSIRIS